MEKKADKLTSSEKLLEALESVYVMSTSFGASLDNYIDQVVLSTSNILQVSFVALGHLENKEFTVTQFNNDKILRTSSFPMNEHPCGIAFHEKVACQKNGLLGKTYHSYMKNYRTSKAYVGVPIVNSKGKLIGSICALDQKERTFREYEIHLMEIFARYIAYQMERKSLERQLMQEQEMKMLGHLTSGVAHEVRNPLNGILAITDALSGELGENSEYKFYIDHIRKQVTRLSRLMSDLLDLGRPIENANLIPTSLLWLVSNAVNTWQHSSEFKDYHIKILSDEESQKMSIVADRAKVEQVIINLLENACAHSQINSEIVIQIARKENNVNLQIIDKGTGFKPEHFNHLFEPFFTTRKGGTGLGLGIVKRIIESHGGEIEIRNNEPPPGALVEISLPINPLEKSSTEKQQLTSNKNLRTVN